MLLGKPCETRFLHIARSSAFHHSGLAVVAIKLIEKIIAQISTDSIGYEQILVIFSKLGTENWD